MMERKMLLGIKQRAERGRSKEAAEEPSPVPDPCHLRVTLVWGGASQRVEQKENDMKTIERVQEPSKIPIEAPAVPPKRIMAATNVFVRFLLRSPFNFGLGNTLLLLTYTGRKSGKRYTNPLPYMREEDVVTVFTYRSWWKNVHGGAPVLVEIKRHRMNGIAEAISDEKAAIATSLLAFLRKNPALAKGYNVPLDADGQPDPEAVRQAAHFVVMVRIHLSGGPTALQPATARRKGAVPRV
jgi:hypothetical protein